MYAPLSFTIISNELFYGVVTPSSIVNGNSKPMVKFVFFFRVDLIQEGLMGFL